MSEEPVPASRDIRSRPADSRRRQVVKATDDRESARAATVVLPRKGARPDGDERALVVEKHQIERLTRTFARQDRHAAGLEGEAERQAESLTELEAALAEAWRAAGLPRPDEREILAQEIDERLEVSDAERRTIHRGLPDLSSGLAVPNAECDWDVYLKEIDRYAAEHALDTEGDPLEQLLPPHRAAEIRRQFDRDFGPTPWDKWDWTTIGLTVLAGTLLDYFLVATPGATFKGEPQRGSPVTGWMKEQSTKLAPMSGMDDLRRNPFQQWTAGLTTKAEDWAKVPYDVVSPKIDLTPNTHRLAAIGHDPILGLAFGAKDIICRTCTFIDSNGAWRVIPGPAYAERGVFEALATVVVHGFSDVFTAKGLPPPFLSALQALKVNSGFAVRDSGDPVSVPNLIRYMYSNGYDLRHFATMAIVPAFAELTLRTYSFIRTRVPAEGRGRDGIRGRLKLSQMLALTHALLASGNIVKTALYGWNPTALNMAQFLALGKQMISLVRLSSERNALIQDDLARGWEALLAAAAKLSPE